MLNAGRDPETGAWMIENDYLRLVATAGRGRAVNLFDKREGAPTGSQIDFWVREQTQQKALSMVQQTDDLATLVLSATDWRGRSTWHASLSLAAGVAAVSVRYTVYNRGWSPLYCSPHIGVSPANSLGITPVRHAAEKYEIGGAAGIVGATFGYREWPLPAQSTAYLEARVLPCSLPRVDFASKDAVAFLEEGKLTLCAAEPSTNNLLVVGSSDEPERTFELRVDLNPANPTEVALDGLPINADRFRLRDQTGRTLLSNTTSQSPVLKQPLGTPRSLEALLGDDDALASAERDAGSEHAAALGRGFIKMGVHDWEAATELLTDACILRGDNPIAWWAKAWCMRQLDADPSHDLANAHYLAPLEPVLRADAYLSAPEDAKPDALLDGWGEDPQPFLEVANLLAIAGLQDVRVRWLEEGRRRAPCGLIEKLLAAAHLEQGRDLAASEHLRFAATAPDRAEAFRRSELTAIERLAEFGASTLE